MAIRDWHWGKFALLWGLWVGLGLSCFNPAASNDDRRGAALVALILLIPLVIMTWRWLSAREKRGGN